MEVKLLHNFIFFRNEQALNNLSLVIENDRIKDIRETKDILPSFIGESYDLKGDYLCPGFVDLQVNGGNHYYYTRDFSVEAFNTIYLDHLKRGTTSILPTIISTSLDNMMKSIEVARECMEDKDSGILGLHLEGPYINVERKGVHNAKYIRNPSDWELDKLLDAGQGVIKKMTIAPEFFSPDMIRKIKDYGIIVSAGHTDCTSKEALSAFSAGVSCVTHIYNAMPPIRGRELGLVGAAMLDDEVFAGIIVDGSHCNNDAVQLMCKSLNDRLFLISDATFIGTENLQMDGLLFIHDKNKYLDAKGKLAGSNITIHDAVINCVKNVKLQIATAFKMGSEIPMTVLKIKDCGKIEKNYVADLLQIDKNDLKLKAVIKSGNFVCK